MRSNRGTLHDTAISDLDTGQEELADTGLYLPELFWLDRSDLPPARDQYSKNAAPARAYVEKLSATL